MAGRKYNPIRILRVKKGESLKSIYERAKKAFTAEDLQQYTVIEPMYPAEELVKELEAINREELRRRKRKKPTHGQPRKRRLAG